MQSTSTLRAQASNLMATAKKKKSVGQVAYLTKQVASLEKDLVRKDIEKLDQKVDGVKTELITKVDGVKTELITKVGNVKTELIAKIDKVDVKIDNVKTELKKDINHLKNNNKIVLGILAVLVTAIFYLHGDNKQDVKELKQDMKELKQDINSRFDKMEKRFDKIEKVIENINQKLK